MGIVQPFYATEKSDRHNGNDCKKKCRTSNFLTNRKTFNRKSSLLIRIINHLNIKVMNIVYKTNCISSNMETLNNLMKGKRKASYKKLKNLIKKAYPELYFNLMLDFYNPYHEETAQTKTYYILVHSAIEYFFLKIK